MIPPMPMHMKLEDPSPFNEPAPHDAPVPKDDPTRQAPVEEPPKKQPQWRL
jgi:hypothetical protein